MTNIDIPEKIEKTDYLGSLMTILAQSPQLPSGLRKQVSALLKGMKEDRDRTSDDVTLLIKVPQFTDDELDDNDNED